VMSPHEAARTARETAQVARELRIVLRDVLSKLSKDIRFTTFRRHVDQSEREVDSAFVKKPMDFETMLQRLDDDAYQTAKQFLEDVALIRSECVAFCKAQQNLDAKPGIRRALHRANELVDHAEWLIEENVDLHLQARAEEFAALNPCDPASSPQYMAQGRASSRLRGISVPDDVFFGDPEAANRKLPKQAAEKPADEAVENTSPGRQPVPAEVAAPAEEEAQEVPELFLCDEKSLTDLVDMLVECSEGFSLEELLGLHHQLKSLLDIDFAQEFDRALAMDALKEFLDQL